MKIYYLPIVALFGIMATSCSNKYEAAIADYIQTIDGTKVDMGFSLKDSKEIQKITVSDSISILNKESQDLLNESIKSAETQLTQFQESLVAEKTKLKPNKTIIDAFLKTIDAKQAEIDSLKAVKPVSIDRYEGRKSDEVLAIVVEAKYKARIPQNENKEEEVVSTFVLSPDGKICYRQLSDAE